LLLLFTGSNLIRSKTLNDITYDLRVLQSHLDSILQRVEHNSLTLKRLQSFEMHLLGLNSLAEILEFILDECKSLFDLEVVSLYLFDPNGEIAECLGQISYEPHSRSGLLLIDNDGLFKRFFDFRLQPVLGLYHPEKYAPFFHGFSEPPSSVILVPLVRRGRYLGSLNLGSRKKDRFVKTMATDFIAHLGSVISVCLENTLNFETLRRTSFLDPLTGVNNRRFMEQRLVEELERSLRSQLPLSCLFLDIDFFKRINDSYGHQTGDYVLSSVASAIKKHLRNSDVLSRYGGEEFVVLLPEADARIAGEIGERIRDCVAALVLDYAESKIPVTLSVGVATFDAGRAQQSPISALAAQLLHAADTALYRAKHDGRNRVVNAGDISCEQVCTV